jgi:hypothetical protein
MLDCYQRPGLVRGGRLSMLNRVIGLFQIFLFAFASHAFAKIENGNPESPDGRFRADYVGDETPLNILDSRGKPIFAFENGTGKYGDGVYWAADSQRLVVVVQYKPIGLPPEQGLRGVTRQAFSRQAGTIKTIGTRISCPPRPAEK